MELGLSFYNQADRAVIASNSIGYVYHSTQTHINIYSSVSGLSSLSGESETYRVNTGERFPPMVFIANTGVVPVLTTFPLSNTAKMVTLTNIYEVSIGIWEVTIRRGYNRVSSATNPIRLLFFVHLPVYTPSGYGMLTYDVSGKISYDSTLKMLRPVITSAFGATIGINQIVYSAIPNYASDLGALGITRPAYLISGNLTKTVTGSSGFVSYHNYYRTLFGLYSNGIAIAFCWAGHSSDGSYSFDQGWLASDPAEPDLVGAIPVSDGFNTIVIDADDYIV
jgi:hypothetical protein